VLILAGLHVPVMALFELFGREGAVEFWHSGPIWVNVGTIKGGITTIVKVVVEAHCPAVGVKVYRVVNVLFRAGDQVPEMPLIDVVGSAERAAPEQMGATAENVGVIFGLTVIVNVAVLAHCPADGAKV
jgi:hypothetical protein